MRSTILIEIELPVTFTATKGYPATHTDPACPDEINDIEFDNDEAIKLIEKYLEDNESEIEESLFDDANQQAFQYECEKAEYKRDQMMDR